MANLKLENEATEINERKRKLDSPTRRMPSSEEERCCEVLISNIPYEFHWQKLKDLIRQKIGEVGHVKIWQDENGRPKGAGVALFPNAELAQKAVDDLNRHDVNGRALVVKKFTEEEKRKRQRLEDKKEARAGGGSRGGDVGDRLGPRQPPAEEETAARILEMVHTIQNSDPSVLRRLGVNENVIDAVQSGQLSDTVFVANIDYTMKWQELKDIFKMAGRVNNVKMVEDSDGKSKGYGTIVFATPLEALEAVAKLHNQSIRDRRITVKIDQMSKNRVSIASLMANYGPRHLPPPPVELMSRPALGSGLSSLAGLGHGSLSSSLLSRELELERLALQREREKILLSSLHSERGGYGPPPYNDDYGRMSSLPPPRPSLEPNVDSLRDGPGFRGMQGPAPQLERDSNIDLRQKELDLLKELEMLRNRMGGSSGSGPPGAAGNVSSSFTGNSSLQSNSSFGRDSLSHGGVSEPNPALAPGFGRSGGNRGTGSCQIFIRNLPFQVNWQMLKDRFSEFGKVLYAEIKMENGKSKGCGIVKFSNSQEAESAIMRMNGKVIDGREIEVRFDSSGL